jgi:hypothetical protein
LNTGQFDEETLCCPSQFEHLLVFVQLLSAQSYIWCPYVPPEKPKLMEELCNHINRKMSENTILVGDLNAKSYQWNNGNENSHGRLLEDCMTQSQLICLNDGQAIRRNSNSIIDLALTTQTTYNQRLPGACNRSPGSKPTKMAATAELNLT